MDFLRGHFDKLLLGSLVVFFAALYLHAVHHGLNDNPFASFCGDSAKLFSGALLTLITGRMLQRSNNSNAVPPPGEKPIAGDLQSDKS